MPFVGSIELGGTKIIVALADSENNIVAQERFPTTTPDEFLTGISAFFEQSQTEFGKPAALGVASFGPINIDPESSDYGLLLNTPKSGWRRFALGEELQRLLPVPMKITTDVSGALIAEHAFGNAKGVDNAVYVTVGTGIGAGIMVGGKIVKGFLHPEIGHMRVPHKKDDGICPFHGNCIEGLIAGPAIAARTGVPGEQLPDDHPIWEEVSEILALMVNNILMTLATERIILGGGVMSKPGLIEGVRTRVSDIVSGYLPIDELAGGVDALIVPPGLEHSSGLVGGAILANRMLCK